MLLFLLACAEPRYDGVATLYASWSTWSYAEGTCEPYGIDYASALVSLFETPVDSVGYPTDPVTTDACGGGSSTRPVLPASGSMDVLVDGATVTLDATDHGWLAEIPGVAPGTTFGVGKETVPVPDYFGPDCETLDALELWDEASDLGVTWRAGEGGALGVTFDSGTDPDPDTDCRVADDGALTLPAGNGDRDWDLWMTRGETTTADVPGLGHMLVTTQTQLRLLHYVTEDDM